MSGVHNNMLVLKETASPSTWDTIKNGVVEGFNWVGRQVKWLGQSIGDFAMKIYEFVKPFFTSVFRFVADSYHAIKEFFMENKQVTIVSLVSIAITLVAVTAIGFLCCSNKNCAKAS